MIYSAQTGGCKHNSFGIGFKSWIGAVANIKTESNVPPLQMEKHKEDAPCVHSQSQTLSPVWAENVADLRLTTENGIKQKISTSSCDLVWLRLMCAVSSGCRGATDWQNTSTKINWQFLYAADVYLPPLYYAVRVCTCLSHVVYKKGKCVYVLQ